MAGSVPAVSLRLVSSWISTIVSLVNVARQLGIEPEAALRVANDKFQRRFDHLERQVKAEGHGFRELTLEQLEIYWQRAKAIPHS